MKIEKLPSGSYRIRKQIKGIKYTVVVEHRPTQKEAEELIVKETMKKTSSDFVQASYRDFNSYCEQFNDELEKLGKSPATIRGYESIRRNISDDFSKKDIFKITEKEVQKEVDDYSEKHSPKSTANYYGYIRSVMGKYRPHFVMTIKLPKRIKKAEYEPSTKDIKRILEASEGTRYDIALHLCSLGLRRGEVVAITAADIDEDNVLTINKDIVLNRYNKYVQKDTPKTSDSNRRILLPSDLADKIRKQGYAYNGDPHSINKYLHTFQDKLGIPRFRLHMMRHFCVAYLHDAGFTDQQIMTWGGWSNSSDIMKRAYRYNLDPEKSQKNIADALSNLS